MAKQCKESYPILNPALKRRAAHVFHRQCKAQRALELLDMVGLSHRKNNKLEQLSGGEQQRGDSHRISQ